MAGRGRVTVRREDPPARRRRKPLTGRRTPAAVKLARLGAAMREGWEHLAECVIRGMDPELFFPEQGEQIDAAVFSACTACQVRLQCLKRAMAAEEASREPSGHVDRHGYFGGLSPRQRTFLAAGREVRLIRPTRDRNRYRRQKGQAEQPEQRKLTIIAG